MSQTQSIMKQKKLFSKYAESLMFNLLKSNEIKNKQKLFTSYVPPVFTFLKIKC